MVPERTSRHLADLSPVQHLPQIMDTLAKYPNLQAYRVSFNYGKEPGSYTAKVFCSVYYQNLVVFNKGYTLFSNSYGFPLSEQVTPIHFTGSVIPAISAERANQLAEETYHYDYCPTTRLGLLNLGTMTSPNYRLIWRIIGTETGYPFVEVDAQDGTIYNSNDGKSFIN